MALLDEGVVDTEGDHFHAAEVFGYVDEANDVAKDVGDGGVIEEDGLVVVGAEEVVVVSVYYGWELAVFDVGRLVVALGSAGVVEMLRRIVRTLGIYEQREGVREAGDVQCLDHLLVAAPIRRGRRS